MTSPSGVSFSFGMGPPIDLICWTACKDVPSRYRCVVPDFYRRQRACNSRPFDRGNMPLPSDTPSFIDDIAATMVADILEACSPDEIQQLIEELEPRL